MSEPQRDVQELVAWMRKLATDRSEGILDECQPEAECDDCDTVRALRAGASALEEAWLALVNLYFTARMHRVPSELAFMVDARRLIDAANPVCAEAQKSGE